MSRRKHIVAEATDGPEDEGPARRCVVGGETWPKERMIRFVVGPEGALIADLAGRLPGRGFWLRAERDVINKALAGKHFAKAARGEVTVPDDLIARLEDLLAKRCLDFIGLARRAGRLAVGFEKVQAALRKEEGGVLIVANDASPAGRAKIRALAPGMATIEPFDAARLGAAVGRDAAVHMAIGPGPLTDQLIAEAARLEGVRGRAHRDAA